MEENIATACGTIKIGFTIKLSRIVLYIEQMIPCEQMSNGPRLG